MKRFGFGKKEEGGSALSLGRKKPQDDANPYAQQTDDDAQSTFSRSTAASSASYGSGLPSGPRAGLPSGPRGGYGAPPPPYASPQPGPGYANDRFGAPGGYGNNRFQSATSQSYDSFQANQSVAIQQPPLRKGGYGGLGEETRDELLAHARPTYVNQQRASEPVSDGYGQSALSDGSYGGGYRNDRVLTEEEQAQQELLDTKNQIKQLREQSVQSSDRSVAILDSTLEQAAATYARLGQQTQSLGRIHQQTLIAQETIDQGGDHVKDLERVNRGILNPTSYMTKAKKEQANARKQQQYQSGKAFREESNKGMLANQRAHDEDLRAIEQAGQRGSGSLGTGFAAQKSKYMFDDDDDDEDVATERGKEEHLDRNMEAMLHKTKMLHAFAVASGKEVERSVEIIEETDRLANIVDDHVNAQRLKLRTIK